MNYENIVNENQINQNNLNNLNNNQNNENYFNNQNYNNQENQQNKPNQLPNKSNNTSLIRILQCLYGIFEDSIEDIITVIANSSSYVNENIAHELMKNIQKSLNSNIDEFLDSIRKFKSNLSYEIPLFKEKNEIDPKDILNELFSYVNDEFKDYCINYKNDVFDKLVESETVPKNLFPTLYDKIENFKIYKSPFYSTFNFIISEFIKCPNCNFKQINDKNLLITNFIPLCSTEKGEISNLLFNYMSQSNNDSFSQNFECFKCSYKSPGKVEKIFINTPKYLIIEFVGERKEEKILDDRLDLSSYNLMNIGPKKYSLYAYIFKENSEYSAFIKTTWCC